MLSRAHDTPKRNRQSSSTCEAHPMRGIIAPVRVRCDRANPSRRVLLTVELERFRRQNNLLTSSTERANLGARRRPPGKLQTRGAGGPSLDEAS
eukprot:141466-Prymnesium_polylepis.1